MSIRNLEKEIKRLKGKVNSLKNDLKGQRNRNIEQDQKIQSFVRTIRSQKAMITRMTNLESIFRIAILTNYGFDGSMWNTIDGVDKITSLQEAMQVPSDHKILRYS